ncbi:hypothetical protein [Brevibacillus reuszeri]
MKLIRIEVEYSENEKLVQKGVMGNIDINPQRRQLKSDEIELYDA